jgi:hypothetical protein
MGQVDQGEQIMHQYMDNHPEDLRARELFNQVMRQLGRPGVDVVPQGLPQALPGQ